MTLKDYLIDLGLMSEDVRIESVDVNVTAEQVCDYLKERGPLSDIDLSAANISGRLSVVGQEFGKFDAENCDFLDNGLTIRSCVFHQDLNLWNAYLRARFELTNVLVEGNLYLPCNFNDLKPDEIFITNLQVKGQIFFGSP